MTIPETHRPRKFSEKVAFYSAILSSFPELNPGSALEWARIGSMQIGRANAEKTLFPDPALVANARETAQFVWDNACDKVSRLTGLLHISPFAIQGLILLGEKRGLLARNDPLDAVADAVLRANNPSSLAMRLSQACWRRYTVGRYKLAGLAVRNGLVAPEIITAKLRNWELMNEFNAWCATMDPEKPAPYTHSEPLFAGNGAKARFYELARRLRFNLSLFAVERAQQEPNDPVDAFVGEWTRDELYLSCVEDRGFPGSCLTGEYWSRYRALWEKKFRECGPVRQFYDVEKDLIAPDRLVAGVNRRLDERRAHEHVAGHERGGIRYGWKDPYEKR